jgi:hypothetical protein
MRFAGRFVLSRWHCVRRLLPLSPPRLQQGLITAQGVTLTRIALVITPDGIMVTIIIGM